MLLVPGTSSRLNMLAEQQVLPLARSDGGGVKSWLDEFRWTDNLVGGEVAMHGHFWIWWFDHLSWWKWGMLWECLATFYLRTSCSSMFSIILLLCRTANVIDFELFAPNHVETCVSMYLRDVLQEFMSKLSHFTALAIFAHSKNLPHAKALSPWQRFGVHLSLIEEWWIWYL